MAVYVMAYTAGRAWIEYLRIDDVQLENVLGLRFNVWTSIVLFVAAAIYVVVSSRRHPGREESIYRDGRGPDPTGEEPAQQSDEESDELSDEPAEDGTDHAEDRDPQDESSDDAPTTGKVSTDD